MSVARLYTIVLLLLVAPLCNAETLRVAVASNFKTTLETLVEDFAATSKYRVILASGSTGKHYAQIRNGAPFDLFFAADVRRPRLLEQQGNSVPGSRFTYAIGKLVLWSPEAGYVDDQGQVLQSGTFRRLAIANPRLAPYGLAAKQVLQQRGLYERLQSRLVRGENIAQTFQFVATGNAQLGFVALSQLQGSSMAQQGSLWTIPESLYDPIEQQAVLLNDTPVARAFIAYIKNEPAGRIIRRFGYATP